MWDIALGLKWCTQLYRNKHQVWLLLCMRIYNVTVCLEHWAEVNIILPPAQWHSQPLNSVFMMSQWGQTHYKASPTLQSKIIKTLWGLLNHRVQIRSLTSNQNDLLSFIKNIRRVFPHFAQLHYLGLFPLQVNVSNFFASLNKKWFTLMDVILF